MVALPQGSYDHDAKPGEFDRLPAGTYTAKIIATEEKPVSNNEDKGTCLELTWQVTEGELAGRLFWQRLLMWFSGPEKIPGKTVQTANQKWASVRKATVGLEKAVSDSDELLHIPCLVTYGPQNNDDRYNEVKSVKPIGGAGNGSASGAASAPARPAPARTSPPVSNGNGGGALPWKKTASPA